MTAVAQQTSLPIAWTIGHGRLGNEPLPYQPQALGYQVQTIGFPDGPAGEMLWGEPIRSELHHEGPEECKRALTARRKAHRRNVTGCPNGGIEFDLHGPGAAPKDLEGGRVRVWWEAA